MPRSRKTCNGSFLVLSDIHACTSDPTSSDSPSYVSTQPASVYGGVDPFDSMLETIRSAKLNISCVICPGDMTNKGEPSGIQYVWRRLIETARTLRASLVIATPGNHDLDSRHQYNDFDARGQAMLIQPMLPVNLRRAYLEFWAEHFTIVDRNDTRFLILNSSAYHGGGKQPDHEMEHGRVSAATLKRIKSAFGTQSQRQLNILVCHHHPDAPTEIGEDDVSLMVGGRTLLDILNAHDVGPWFVIHGHRHRPRLFYAASSGDGPIVLGAASFSAQINRDAQNKCPNQFHVVDFDFTGASLLGVGLAGAVRSWNWIVGDNWYPAQTMTGLPHRAGFGFRGQAASMAVPIVSSIPQGEYLHWSELLARVPALGFMLPNDFQKLEAALKIKGVTIAYNEGSPFQVSRK
jgi:hypothetical protein